MMDIGTPGMVRHIRGTLGEAVMREALATAEPGNFSPESWNYWHVVFGIRPTPPLPVREIPDSPYVSAEIRRAAASAARDLAAAR
ncbi:MAG: hypothetical protein Q7S40_02615 [Opitutaceae bacterium]|nr:hypothetical protein [Opitutaceae bacterium]